MTIDRVHIVAGPDDVRLLGWRPGVGEGETFVLTFFIGKVVNRDRVTELSVDDRRAIVILTSPEGRERAVCYPPHRVHSWQERYDEDDE